MQQSMTRYLDRARMAARVGVIGRVTPVAAGHRAAGAHAAAHPPGQGRRHQRRMPGGRALPGEKQDLEEMLGNLLDNACKWARRDGGADRRGAAVDRPRAQPAPCRSPSPTTDPGLNDEQRARIGKRGLRLDETKPGSGLGLVDRHGACPLLRRHVRTCACATGRPGGAFGPPGGLNSLTARFAAKQPGFGHGRCTFVG